MARSLLLPQPLAHTDSLLDGISGLLIEIDDLGVFRSNLNVYFRATEGEQLFLRDSHQASGNGSALVVGVRSEFVHPPAKSVKSGEDGSDNTVP